MLPFLTFALTIIKPPITILTHCIFMGHQPITRPITLIGYFCVTHIGESEEYLFVVELFVRATLSINILMWPKMVR